ncbi:hypothetical protein HYH03_001945 [Edaphochlamys debaryana]|uniref:Uncharacterized protein n=1 Tax=Edaphochlamys debaryana TaxID=47281 RepID=A0A835YD17_9CHLO|nr:hypothetical protein HYH03_001945 [Edaphochlamys debaryana]|eukprot:KAG2500371.1 hypothetical protein HYH03_001945 [Edaphochlamys debaryana]
MLTSCRTASRVATSPRSGEAWMSPALRGPSARPRVATRAGPSSGDKRAPAPATNPALMTAVVVWGSIGLSLTIIAGGLILRGAIEASVAEIRADMADTRAEIKADFAEIRAGFKADVAEARARMAKWDERRSALELELAGRREVLEYMQQLAEENQQ